MKISQKTVVTLKYKLSDESGKLLDSSEKDGSLVYIHGVGLMMAGIEKAIDGQEEGFSFSGVIDPKDAYGEYNPAGVVPVPKDHFAHLIDKIEEGKLYNFDTGAGSTQMLKVIKIDEDFVTVDSNHPHAGESLNLECTVENVRAANEEELASLKSEHSSCGCSSGESGGCCSSGDKSGDGCCSSSGEKSGGCNCSH